MFSVEKLETFFAKEFPKAKPPTLPLQVIEAVTLYDKPEHQLILRNWLKHDKQAVDANGQTLLHHAAATGHPQLVDYLLKRGLDKDCEDNKKFTPLIYAVLKLHELPANLRPKVIVCIERLLIAGAKVVSSGLFPQVAVNIAAQMGQLEALKLLEQHGATLDEDIMGTPLWWAENSTTSNPDVLDYLKTKGCSARMGPS